jgi:hypothetical protein
MRTQAREETAGDTSGITSDQKVAGSSPAGRTNLPARQLPSTPNSEVAAFELNLKRIRLEFLNFKFRAPGEMLEYPAQVFTQLCLWSYRFLSE